MYLNLFIFQNNGRANSIAGYLPILFKTLLEKLSKIIIIIQTIVHCL